MAIEADKYLAYYKGIARDIVVRSEDNLNLKFPADAIRKFLTHEGIFGLFEIQFDENNKADQNHSGKLKSLFVLIRKV